MSDEKPPSSDSRELATVDWMLGQGIPLFGDKGKSRFRCDTVHGDPVFLIEDSIGQWMQFDEPTKGTVRAIIAALAPLTPATGGEA